MQILSQSALTDTTADAGGSARRIGGVLGGMGPLATVDFLHKIIALTPANCDQEHVPLIVHQIPQIPDRSSAILEGSDAPLLPMLRGLRRLAAAGAEFSVIPCNSAHHWYEQLSAGQPLKIVHIADAVLHELHVRSWGSKKLVILGTRGTVRSGFYSARLRTNELVTPNEAAQRLIDETVLAVKTGHYETAEKLANEVVVGSLAGGTHVPVLACTELPVAMRQSALLEFCIDSTMALARYCVAESKAAENGMRGSA